MRQVQEALRDIGIPVIAGVWRATSAQQNPPAQYCVYSTTTTEAAHEDDHPSLYRTYVYLNLWSDIDPTEMRLRIRERCTMPVLAWWKSQTKGTISPPTTQPLSRTPCSGHGVSRR